MGGRYWYGAGGGFLTSLALSKLAHGRHNGLGAAAVKVQIRRWSEFEGASTSGQCPAPQPELYTAATPIYLLLICGITKSCSFPISFENSPRAHPQIKGLLTVSRAWGMTSRNPKAGCMCVQFAGCHGTVCQAMCRWKTQVAYLDESNCNSCVQNTYSVPGNTLSG